MWSNDALSRLKGDLLPAVRKAGEAVMRIYAGDIDVAAKGDSSPVTAADHESEAILLGALDRLAPEIPVIAEESVAAGRIPSVGRSFWLVDPLDGTREFIGRNGEFTVNVALIDDGRPRLGVVLAPAIGAMYWGIPGVGAGIEDSSGARSIACRTIPEEGMTVVASRSHGDPAALERFLAGRSVARVIDAGSSLKLCLIAAGAADLYPRLGRTMEWDIAAGHAVLVAAGGSVETLDGKPLTYGKPGFDNPHFAAWGR